MENKETRLDWYDDAAEINKMAADAEKKEAKFLEAGLKTKIATGVGAAVLAGSVASKEPAKLVGLPGKEPVVATRELSGKRKEEESRPYAEYKIEKRGEHKKRQISRNAGDSTLPMNAAEGVDIFLGDIGDLSSKWGTPSGRALLDSVVRAYANFNMAATFNHIVVNIYVVPHEMITTRCKDPNTGETYNTEYACTVNPDTMLTGVGDVLIPRYEALAQTMRDSTVKPIPCFDDESLRFTVYFSEKLTDSQRAELLVHELKHCMVIYAFVQKIASIIAYHIGNDKIRKFIGLMGEGGGLMKLNNLIGQKMDNSEQFDVDKPFTSNYNIIDDIMGESALRPYVNKD